MKHESAFYIAVRDAQKRDPRYAVPGYVFLCDALAHTLKLIGREDAENRHVAGPELLAGFRDLALREFGPMALCVLRDWGITRSEDVGNMVYLLINAGYFGKNETDSIEDFSDGVSLEEALTKPFRPAKSMEW